MKCQIDNSHPKAIFKCVCVRVCGVVSRYSIDRNTDLERFFNIDALSGVISTAKPLDREVNSVHNLTILAIETREFTHAVMLTPLTAAL